MAQLVNPNIIKEQLRAINGSSGTWGLKVWLGADAQVHLKLVADYKFRTFTKTWDFLNKVAASAHLAKHHPTIRTTYNKVDLELTTHDVGNQVTYNDLRMAQMIEDSRNSVLRSSNTKSMNDMLSELRQQTGVPRAPLAEPSKPTKTDALIEEIMKR